MYKLTTKIAHYCDTFLIEYHDIIYNIIAFFHQVTLGDWVYVASKLTSTDLDLKVVVNHCWVTPFEDSDISENSTEVYYIMRDKYVDFTINDDIILHMGRIALHYIKCGGIINTYHRMYTNVYT